MFMQIFISLDIKSAKESGFFYLLYYRLYSGGGLLRTSKGDEVLLKAQKMDNLWRRVGSVAIGGATIKYQTNAIGG